MGENVAWFVFFGLWVKIIMSFVGEKGCGFVDLWSPVSLFLCCLRVFGLLICGFWLLCVDERESGMNKKNYLFFLEREKMI